MRNWKTWVVVILAILVVAGAGFLGFRSTRGEATPAAQAPSTVPVTRGDVQLTVTAPGYVVGTKEMLLGMTVAGTLAEIDVRPGDAVHAGDVLAKLDDRQLSDALATARLREAQAEADNASQLSKAEQDLQIAEAQLKQARESFPTITATQASLAVAQSDLDKALKGPDQESLTRARAEMDNAEVALKQAQAAYDKVAWRGDIAALPQAVDLEKATNNYAISKATYDQLISQNNDTIANDRAKLQQAQAAYDQARQQQSASEQGIAALEATVEKARLTVEHLKVGADPLLARDVQTAEANLKAATLTAPFDGTVLDVRAKPGETMSEGKGFIVLADPAAVEVNASVIEEDLPLVQVGQSVEIFFDAVPEAIAHGKVARIAPQRTSDDRPTYPVYIALDEVPKGVLAGMTADTSIIITQKSDVLRLPRSLVRATAGSAFLDVWANGQAEKRAVQVGLRGDVYVEVVNGLNEGEQVVGQWQQPSTNNQKDQPSKGTIPGGSSKQ